MPKPTQPLRNRMGNESPRTDLPNKSASVPRTVEARMSRARLACVPVTKCASRRPVIAANEKRVVARNAANIRRQNEEGRRQKQTKFRLQMTGVCMRPPQYGLFDTL